jgi:biotin carboxylase
MNVLMISPGFPAEMPLFTRGLATIGSRVIGIGEQPAGQLPEMARSALQHYAPVGSLWDEAAVLAEARRLQSRFGIDRVECLWEPAILLAARLREGLGLPGMGVDQATLFRDKEKMKIALDGAGVRTPRHARATDAAECREAAERIGWPLILKPIAGAGSADTYRVNDSTELERTLPRLKHVAEISVEEFIEGEEFTFDTICAEGRILYHNVSWYRPRPLIGRTVEWISPQTVSLRRPEAEELRGGVEMGHRVLETLGFRDGFTHMEWFRTAEGEAVFGEIAARPPGARSVDLMNYACDFDSYAGWAEAVCHGRLSQAVERRYNSAVVFKRARGQGRIQRVVGLERLVARYRPHIVCIDLSPIGASRRDWKQTLISDGYLLVRHPDLQTTLEIADRVGTDLQIEAG